MSWYRTGTISVTNGSPTVSGVGTAWIDAIHAGWGIGMPNGTLYEIASVNSATSLTLAKPYEGASQTAQSYSVMPTQGAISQLYTQVKALIEAVQSTIDGAGKGKFLDGTAAVPGVRFAADEDSGLARLGTNLVALVTSGIARLKLSSTDLQVNVPITGSAVQSNGEDALSGKILRTGAQRISGSSTTITAGLNYIWGSWISGFNNQTGGPVDLTGAPSDGYGLLIQAQRAEWRRHRIFQTLTGQLFHQHETSEGLQTPRRVFDTGNLIGPVSQSGGAPTGAVIEYGSNANGDYVRYADGTQICWKRRDFTGKGITLAYGSIFTSANLMTGDALLPIAFKGGSSPTFYITASIESAAGGQLVGGIGDTGNFPASVYVTYHQSLTNRALHMNAMAIGRWY